MQKPIKTAMGWRILAYAGKDAEGKRHYRSFSGPNLKKVECAAAEYTAKHKRERSSENLTFQTAAERYLENKKNVLSPCTLRGYKTLLDNAYPLLLDATLDRLMSSDLIQRQMNENAARYSAKTLFNQHGFITAVMGYFRFKPDPVTLKPKEHNFYAVPSKEEAEKIICLLREAPDIECQALLALTCSLRQSEIAGLHVRDISGNVVNIRGAKVIGVSRERVFKTTNKSYAGTRRVVMPDYLARRMAETCAGRGPDDFVFAMDPDLVRHKLGNLLKSHGMHPYTMHSLRHCFAAIMHAQGVPDKYVMEMGGWSSDYVLRRVYQYTFADETAKMEAQANAYFNGVMSATPEATKGEKMP